MEHLENRRVYLLIAGFTVKRTEFLKIFPVFRRLFHCLRDHLYSNNKIRKSLKECHVLG